MYSPQWRGKKPRPGDQTSFFHWPTAQFWDSLQVNPCFQHIHIKNCLPLPFDGCPSKRQSVFNSTFISFFSASSFVTDGCISISNTKPTNVEIWAMTSCDKNKSITIHKENAFVGCAHETQPNSLFCYWIFWVSGTPGDESHMANWGLIRSTFGYGLLQRVFSKHAMFDWYGRGLHQKSTSATCPLNLNMWGTVILNDESRFCLLHMFCFINDNNNNDQIR